MGTAAAARSSPRPPPGGVSPSTCLPHALTPADVPCGRAQRASPRRHVMSSTRLDRLHPPDLSRRAQASCLSGWAWAGRCVVVPL